GVCAESGPPIACTRSAGLPAYARLISSELRRGSPKRHARRRQACRDCARDRSTRASSPFIFVRLRSFVSVCLTVSSVCSGRDIIRGCQTAQNESRVSLHRNEHWPPG